MTKNLRPASGALALLVLLLSLESAWSFYNPKTGRWLTRDPIEEQGGVNLNLFGDNSPTTRIDKDGRITLNTTPGDLILQMWNDRGCNSYYFAIEVNLDQTPARDGYIVQEVMVTEDWYRCGCLFVTHHRNWVHFWEHSSLIKAGAANPVAVDSDGEGGGNNRSQTTGSIETRTELRWYDKDGPDGIGELNWGKGTEYSDHSTITRPLWWGGDPFNGPEQPAWRSTLSSWVCCCEESGWWTIVRAEPPAPWEGRR